MVLYDLSNRYLTGIKKQKMVGGFPTVKTAIEAQARGRRYYQMLIFQIV